ncbi:MAG: hypothetical protein ABIN01_08760 [Ferruginibacter sp.]
MDVLCVDMGNVIIDHVGFGTTVEFFNEGDYRDIPPVEDVLLYLKQLNEGRFKKNVFVVYNATLVADSKIDDWLAYHRFWEITGITQDKVLRSKSGRNKLAFCIDNNVSHLIDDRLEVLGNLISFVSNLYLFRGQPEEINQYSRFLPLVNKVNNWKEVSNLLNNDD